MQERMAMTWWQRWSWGYAVVLGSMVVSYLLWLGGLWRHDGWYDDEPWKYVAKIGSHGAVMLMCWSFLLATRFRAIERLFGGLDKVYAAHRRIGIAAFALVLLHPLSLAMPLVGDGLAWLGFFAPSRDWVRNTGLLALLGFAVLLILSLLAATVPYHRWKRSHNCFGLVFAVVILHAVLAPGEITAYPLLRAWFAVWAILAALAYLYIRVLYRWIGPMYPHRVVERSPRGADIVEIHLEPRGRRLHHRPGQFLYISFDAQALSPELHPFSISSGPEAARLRLSIKQVGDWTANVDRIAIGDTARVWGPYGMFSTALFHQPTREAVLVGGGIGITPFLSILASADFARRPGRSWLIYSVIAADESIYREEIEERTATLARVEARFHVSDDEGFIDRAYLATVIGDDERWAERLYLLCGPAEMAAALTELLRQAGVPPAAIISEAFVLR